MLIDLLQANWLILSSVHVVVLASELVEKAALQRVVATTSSSTHSLFKVSSIINSEVSSLSAGIMSLSEWYLVTSSVRFELVVVPSIPHYDSGSLHRISLVGGS
jgi:hypothetical protein